MKICYETVQKKNITEREEDIDNIDINKLEKYNYSVEIERFYSKTGNKSFQRARERFFSVPITVNKRRGSKKYIYLLCVHEVLCLFTL